MGVISRRGRCEALSGIGALPGEGVVEVMTYTGDFHREGDVWVAEVREVPQAHTYGRTLARTKAYLRDALALYLDVAVDTVEISVHVHGADGVSELVETAIRTREQADALTEQARQATSRAAVALVRDAGLSFRDAGAALGMLRCTGSCRDPGD